MFRNTLDKYKNDLGEIKHDEKALKEELSRVRFNYNFCNCFSSGVILTLLVDFLEVHAIQEHLLVYLFL